MVFSKGLCGRSYVFTSLLALAATRTIFFFFFMWLSLVKNVAIQQTKGGEEIIAIFCGNIGNSKVCSSGLIFQTENSDLFRNFCCNKSCCNISGPSWGLNSLGPFCSPLQIQRSGLAIVYGLYTLHIQCFKR